MRTRLTRRTFLVTGGLLGGGLALGYVFTPNRLALRARSTADHTWLTSWVSINPDNTITVLVPQVEMGQGVLTSLPMMLAEEMDADWSLVKVSPAPAEELYVTEKIVQGFTVGDVRVPKSLQRLLDYSMYKGAGLRNLQITGASSSVRFTGQWGMRVAGAAAKEMLVRAAAERWGAEPAECRARLSHIYHDTSGRSAGFAELAELAAEITPPLTPALKNKKDYVICGQPLPRVDTPELVTGALQYSLDVKPDGMKIAAVRHAPVFGGDVVSFESASINNFPGVQDVLRVPGAVVVTADNYWRAKQAVSSLAVKFGDGGNGGFDSEKMFRDFAAALDGKGDRDEVDFEQGDVVGTIAGFVGVMEAEYRVPFLAHATMEPMNCTAHHHDDRLELWVGTQNPLSVRAVAAKAAGLNVDDVILHPLQLGGGFGRRLAPGFDNFIEDAVHAAMQVDYPVKVIWSREEDIQHDYYRPAVLSRFAAAATDDGLLTAWSNRYTDIGLNNDVEAALIPYAAAHQRIARVTLETPVPIGYWRSVEHSYHGFFIESFIDELACHAGIDPLEYRLRLLDKQPRYQAVLKLAAEKIGWGQSLPAGAGMGIAVVESFGTIVAQAVQVAMVDAGVQVKKVVAAVDPGEIINPAIASAQIEGAVIFGLSAALYGEITVTNGRTAQNNFPNYPMLRLSAAPRIEVHFIESGASIGGMGEVGVPPVAPALCNAIFAANGQRLRRLPVTTQL